MIIKYSIIYIIYYTFYKNNIYYQNVNSNYNKILNKHQTSAGYLYLCI